MKYIPQGSIRSFLSIPQVTPTNLSAVPCSAVAEGIKNYWQLGSNGEARPETEAIEFYALNHLVSVLRGKFDPDETLPDWAQRIMDKYVSVLASQGQRLFSYIILITARESRHLKNASVAMKKANPNHKLWHGTVKGKGSLGVANAFVETPPDCTIGEFTAANVQLFNNGSFGGGGYGGPPWGNISECSRKMVFGETSIEVMIDTAYTLAHNNGPMFNKGMLYLMYDGSTLIKLLDIQRAGQVPEAILNQELNSSYFPADIVLLVKEMQDKLNVFGKYVDWNKVEAFSPGGHKYTKQKAAMPTLKISTPPPPPPVVPQGPASVLGSGLEVFPGQSVQVVTRKKVA